MTTKAAKEAFYAGHSGGSIWEPQLLIALCVASYVLYRSLARRLPAGILRVPIEAIVLGGVPLAGITLASNQIAELILFVLGVGGLSLIAPLPSRPFLNIRPKQFIHRRPFSIVFRAVLQLLTVAAILAVDFTVFPRRFAKTESFGYSLMDLGVGGFIFSNGFVAGPRLKSASSRNLIAVLKSFVIALPILVLGVVRFISMRAVEYHEHVTEYGVHWNFFLTLGFIPLLTALVQYAIPNIHFGVAGAVIMGIYEYVLTQRNLQRYILHAKREGSFFQLNREGICSFFGYWAIFFIAAHIGERVLTTHKRLAELEAPLLGIYKKKKGERVSNEDETEKVPRGNPETPDTYNLTPPDGFSIDLLNIIDLISIFTALATFFVPTLLIVSG
ncbi:UNVERIFIED_CONTAM: Glucosaminyl phosphatidylinositol (GlcN-PI) nositol acylation protein [Siphonaria sp. JEL0065]|nr:Glucosaminyl phosphatidylinositol (GlcN-PI) nositol acylation protein [Siphonaria sp. JEL0065]